MRAFLSRNLITSLANRPIFIIGTGRSGTSILLQAFGAHPFVFAARGEAPLISYTGRFMASFDPENDISRNYITKAIKVPREHVNETLKRLNFEISFGPHYGFRKIVKNLLIDRTKFMSKRFWASKIFADEESCRGLRCLYPEAKFIYIVRDGMSVVQSRMKFSGFNHNTFETHCRSWQNDSNKYAYLGTADFAVHLYYEEMLDDPDQFFDSIFQSLNIPSDPGPADYVKENLIHPLDEGDKKGVDARDILKSRSAPYTNWTDEQKQMFIDICSPGMKKHGYEIPFA